MQARGARAPHHSIIIYRLRGGGKDDDDFNLPKFSGTRGPEWDEWQKDFVEWASAQFSKDSNDEFSLHQVALGVDQGAGAGPAWPGAGPPLIAAQRRYRKRQLILRSALSKAQKDARLRSMILNLPAGNMCTTRRSRAGTCSFGH